MRPSSFLSSFVAAATLAGCAQTVVKVEEAILCPIDPKVLAERCAEPLHLADGATYQDVITTAQTDRMNLKTCSAHDALLANTIAKCNDEIAKYNENIKAINRKYSDKP